MLDRLRYSGLAIQQDSDASRDHREYLVKLGEQQSSGDFTEDCGSRSARLYESGGWGFESLRARQKF